MNTIKIMQTIASPTNTQGRNEGKGFEDLVASVREKGILVPILVRAKGDRYEVIAGGRRLAAAKVVGLAEIPANIVKMNDTEAHEAQIVENLQRQDIHPLDEGEAYRSLIEKSKPRYEVKDVAAKVGKSETYVRQRLALTNLSARAAKMYRDGKMRPTSAVLLARIDDAKTQDKVISDAGEYRLNDADSLRDLIQAHVYKNLTQKPWAKDAKLSEMVGDRPNHTSLFGDKSAGSDPVSYAQQMAAYIEIMIRKSKEEGIEMVRICTEYGKPDAKNVLDRDSYRTLLAPKTIKEAKVKMKGIVAQGRELGQIFWITTDPEEIKGTETYRRSPKEKAERKKELAKQRKVQADQAKAFRKAIAKVRWPISQKQLDALFDFAMRRCGFSYQQPACKLLGLEPVKVSEKIEWGENEGKMRTRIDYEATIVKYAGEGDALKKLRAIFAILMPHPSPNYPGDFTKASNKL